MKMDWSVGNSPCPEGFILGGAGREKQAMQRPEPRQQIPFISSRQPVNMCTSNFSCACQPLLELPMPAQIIISQHNVSFHGSRGN